MYGQSPAGSRSFTLEELEDQQDLRAVIAAALAATPLDEASLRRGVWTYVRAEHHLGTSPGAVIVTLTELVDASPLKLVSLESVPIHRLERFNSRLTREFTTAIVRCVLSRPN